MKSTCGGGVDVVEASEDAAASGEVVVDMVVDKVACRSSPAR